jgi:hypothetical protein
MIKHNFIPCDGPIWQGWLRCTECKLRILEDEKNSHDSKECNVYSPWPYFEENSETQGNPNYNQKAPRRDLGVL